MKTEDQTRIPDIVVAGCDSIVALDLKDLLMMWGYPCPERTRSWEKTLHRIRSKRPDLMILDGAFAGDPRKNRLIAWFPGKFRIPVVFLDDGFPDRACMRLRASGSFYPVMKPYDGAELHGIVRRILGNPETLS